MGLVSAVTDCHSPAYKAMISAKGALSTLMSIRRILVLKEQDREVIGYHRFLVLQLTSAL